MENLTVQASNLQNQTTSAASNAVAGAQASATNAVAGAQSAATNAIGGATSAVSDLQSKIPQVPKLPPIPSIPGVPEFKTKELPVPKKFKNSKFKDKLAAASEKAKQLAAKGQAAVAGAQAKAQAAVAGAQAKVQSTIATAQDKAQKAVSNAQDKVNKGIASAEEKATAMGEKAKQSVQNDIDKIKEGNGGKSISAEEKDKLVINKTTELAVKDAKPTQDAAKAALAKSNQTIGKPDLSEPEKFVKTHTTPEIGKKFYLYQYRGKDGLYYTSAFKNENKSGYVNGTSFVGGTNQQAINSLINHLDNTYDYVPD
jgi:hypothetical protein